MSILSIEKASKEALFYFDKFHELQDRIFDEYQMYNLPEEVKDKKIKVLLELFNSWVNV